MGDELLWCAVGLQLLLLAELLNLNPKNLNPQTAGHEADRLTKAGSMKRSTSFSSTQPLDFLGIYMYYFLVVT